MITINFTDDEAKVVTLVMQFVSSMPTAWQDLIDWKDSNPYEEEECGFEDSPFYDALSKLNNTSKDDA